MNKNRRRQLADITERIEGIIADLEQIRDDEQDAYDNLPESIQVSERGDAMTDNVYSMDDAIETLQSAIDTLDGID